MIRLKKFDSQIVSMIELVVHLVAYFPVILLGWSMSFYYSPNIYCFGRQSRRHVSQVLQRVVIKFVAAPLALMAFIMVSAFCFLPFVMTWWINKAFDHKDYMHIQFEGGKGGNNLRKSSYLANKPSGGISFGIVSGNVLAGTEFHGASQGVKGAYGRFFTFLRRIVDKCNRKECASKNDSSAQISENKENSSSLDVGLESRWPNFSKDVDVVCFQEVWDIYNALALIAALRRASDGAFTNFIFNAQRCTIGHNWVVFGSSGLFVASKHPIEEAQFVEYELMQKKNLYLRGINYGILSVKVGLGFQAHSEKKGNTKMVKQVGIVSNLHFPFSFGMDEETANNEAPVGEIKDWLKRLDFTLATHRTFEQKQGSSQNQNIAWSTVLGDFNFSNDKEFIELHQHTLFKNYLDHGMKTPGCDIKRALPSTFKVSSYETLWKHFDPDDLARWMEESRRGSGENFKTHMVGRLDRILVDKSREFREVEFVKYLTVLAGTSDHIPLYIKLKSTVNSTQQPTC